MSERLRKGIRTVVCFGGIVVGGWSSAFAQAPSEAGFRILIEGDPVCTEIEMELVGSDVVRRAKSVDSETGDYAAPLPAAAGDVLRLRCLDPDLSIEPAERTLALVNAGFNTLDGFRIVLSFQPPPEAPAPASPAPDPGPCREDSLACREDWTTRLASLLEAGECEAAVLAADEMIVLFPEMKPSFRLLAENFDLCDRASPAAGRGIASRWAMRILGESETVWCDRKTSRLAGELHERFDAARSAAESASRASSRCVSAAEWAFYFRLQLSEVEAAREEARKLEGSVRDLLSAWVDRLDGICLEGVDPWPRIDPTLCDSLPEPLCLRQQARLILQCSEGETLESAAETLRYGLPPNGEIPDTHLGLAQDLAEIEAARENWMQALDLWLELARRTTEESELKRLQCRIASAQRHTDQVDEARRTFSALVDEPLLREIDRTAVLNNLLVLEVREGGVPASSQIEELARRLERSAEEGSADAKRAWRQDILLNQVVFKNLIDPKDGSAKSVRRAQKARKRLIKELGEVLRDVSPLTDVDRPCTDVALVQLPNTNGD